MLLEQLGTVGKLDSETQFSFRCALLARHTRMVKTKRCWWWIESADGDERKGESRRIRKEARDDDGHLIVVNLKGSGRD
jgi:hypothetical protein